MPWKLLFNIVNAAAIFIVQEEDAEQKWLLHESQILWLSLCNLAEFDASENQNLPRCYLFQNYNLNVLFSWWSPTASNQKASLCETQQWLMVGSVLSHVLGGWMMSKLLSLKAAKLFLFVPAAGQAEDIVWHWADRTIPLKSQATLQVAPWKFYDTDIFLLICFICISRKRRAEAALLKLINNWALISLIFLQPTVTLTLQVKKRKKKSLSGNQ